MNYITTLYSVRKIVRTVAKLFAWLAGIQTGILFLLATGADAPLPFTSAPAIRFGICILVYFIAPRIIDALIRKLAARPA
ncbi:hypothetical protein ACWMTA_004348 [Escherichia coli]